MDKLDKIKKYLQYKRIIRKLDNKLQLAFYYWSYDMITLYHNRIRRVKKIMGGRLISVFFLFTKKYEFKSALYRIKSSAYNADTFKFTRC